MSNDSENKPVEIFEDEKGVLLDHDYDGIRELDHVLPRWWVWLFIGTIVFSVPYWIYYHHAGGPSLQTIYEKEMAEVEKKRIAYEKSLSGFDLVKYNAYIQTDDAARIGKRQYERRCRACHAEDGGGGIGPNLTDNYWMHGDGSAESVYKAIEDGFPDKGMQAWKNSMSEEQIMAVVAYVLAFKGTTPADPKAPQGEELP